MTWCEMIVLRSKAMKCIRQGEANPAVKQTAKNFVWRAIQHMRRTGFMAEAKILTEKLLDNNPE